MNKNRSRTCKSEHCACIPLSHTRKSKKRSHISERKSDRVIDWHNDSQNDENGDLVTETAYEHTFHQQSTGLLPQTMPIQNGQRLFTAISDPSVCSYPTMPVTYAMEPVSLPHMYRLYQPVTANYRPTRCRRTSTQNHMVPHTGPDVLTNGCKSLRKNGSCQMAASMCQQTDYASLPSTANIDNKNNKDELSSEHRRYSDPGLGPADAQTDGKSDDSDSPESGSSITTISQSNKLVVTLVEQMTAMKETNNQLFKELHRTKEELQSVKSELNRLKQYTSTGYQPGMLSDIIREIKEASRIREDAMITRVKSMLDEQHSPKLAELEHLKIQVESLSENKTENDRRIARLEEELAAVKISASNGNQREIAAFEEENLSLRRELQEARASRNLAEKHSSKLEKLVKILRKKVNIEEETISKTKYAASGSTFSNAEYHRDLESLSRNIVLKEEEKEDEEILFSDESDSFTDDSNTPPKSNSTNNSSNSLSGPVTDL